uniref:Uncharacterized protein n=1 Tax=Oryza brachyantha TaxID=4533 RepID=J3MRG9_ORYBR
MAPFIQQFKSKLFFIDMTTSGGNGFLQVWNVPCGTAHNSGNEKAAHNSGNEKATLGPVLAMRGRDKAVRLKAGNTAIHSRQQPSRR